jgi:hypothetical protein
MLTNCLTVFIPKIFTNLAQSFDNFFELFSYVSARATFEYLVLVALCITVLKTT